MNKKIPITILEIIWNLGFAHTLSYIKQQTKILKNAINTLKKFLNSRFCKSEIKWTNKKQNCIKMEIIMKLASTSWVSN